MNIFKFLNRSGKIALSAMQAVGLTAVVGAAGFGAWQYLSGPADDPNAFNPAQYNPGEVVYISGANTGGYSGRSYGNGDPGSSVQVSSRTLQQLDRQAMAERAAREMEEESSQIYSSADPAPGAYQMGATEGLGMGANFVSDANSNSSPGGVLSQSMAGMKNMIAKAQQQVAGKAGGKQPAGEDKDGTSPALGSVTPNWSRGAGGSSGGSSFALQNSGKNKGGRNAAGGAGNGPGGVADALATAQEQAAGMLEGARIRGKSSFGPMDTLGANRDATVDKGRRGRDGKNDLEFITKRSADAAANRYRAANEGSRAFLASTQVSGGMRITAENVTTGQGQGSKDFDTDMEAQLRGLRTWGADLSATEVQRDADRAALGSWMLTAGLISVVCMALIAVFSKLPPWGYIVVALAAAVIAFLVYRTIEKSIEYGNAWGWGGGLAIGGLAAAALMLFFGVAAFVWPTAIANFVVGFLKLFGVGLELGATVGGSAAVVGGAGAAGGGVLGALTKWFK